MGTKSKLDEVRGKVEVDFANIYDANRFKQEMEDRFEDDTSTYVSSNFKIQESFKKIYEGGYTTFTNHVGEKDSFYDIYKSEKEAPQYFYDFAPTDWGKRLKDRFERYLDDTDGDEIRAGIKTYNYYMNSDIIHDLQHDGDYANAQALKYELKKFRAKIEQEMKKVK